MVTCIEPSEMSVSHSSESSLSPSEFPTTITDAVCLIQLPVRLTVAEAVLFKQYLQLLLQGEQKLSQMCLDFAQTTFIDSSGIGALITSARITRQLNIDLYLQHVKAEIKTIFALADLEDAFQMVPEPVPLLPEVTPASPVIVMTHPSVQSQAKRWMDIVGALVGLSITGVLLIPIAIAITLNNPGPIFFGQTRCGLMGRRFKVWKFRSMVTNAEMLKSQVENEVKGAFFKNANDPRITKVGKFLRKTSLDELPQFWNVLIGDMSLVGTRPPTPDEIELYEVPNWQRLDVKPGMTGEWQVHGRSTVKTFEEVIQLDLRYQQRWSLSYDWQLICKTIQVLFSKNTGAF
jgi:anti-anti-sigma factor